MEDHILVFMKKKLKRDFINMEETSKPNWNSLRKHIWDLKVKQIPYELVGYLIKRQTLQNSEWCL